jgi:hypothetical protein
MNATRALWARTSVRLWPERYRLVSLPVDRMSETLAFLAGQAHGFLALVRERDEISLTVETEAWDTCALLPLALHVSPPYRALTLDLELELSVVGYLAPAAGRLAEAGISIVPQCAYLRDHLLVQEQDAERAKQVLEGYAASCRDVSAS